MKATIVLMLLFLVLCAFISLLLLNLSMLYHNLFKFSSTCIFRYSVINSIVLVILARSFRSSACGVDELLPPLQFFDGVSEEQIKDIGYASEDSEINGSGDYDSHCGSSGYEEDNDDNGSDSEIDWIEDKEETDHDLENKVEAFISKVIQGWKEEQINDKNTEYVNYLIVDA
ncbi:hypothetical protein POM88_030950 [Heracleum sosnowskyi]|uniref:Uncharacterized protein n=1 Tax=Heracleum sosnowskyi TaxID=360622 RepID=A0AAD8HYE7_9APIA|nr:hypothetical protein POM88_030950 [Heracleum sosnowskyi]